MLLGGFGFWRVWQSMALNFLLLIFFTDRQWLIASISHYSSRISRHYGKRGYRLCDNGAHGNDGAVAYGNTIDDTGLGANPDILANHNPFGLAALAIDGHIRCHAMIEGVDGDIVGNTGLVTYHYAATAAIQRAAVVDTDLPAYLYRSVQKAVGGYHGLIAQGYRPAGFGKQLCLWGDKAVLPYADGFKGLEPGLNRLLPGKGPLEMLGFEAIPEPGHPGEAPLVLRLIVIS